jgi:thioredoxin reductase
MMNGHEIGRYIAVDPMGATSVPGVWAAGNVTNLTSGVINAAAAGVMSAAAVNADLSTEDTAAAVAVARGQSALGELAVR